MNPDYAALPAQCRPLVIQPHDYLFTCRGCDRPGVSESPNTRYHQTAACQRVKAARAAARAKRRKS